jgi:hypothetical protein
MHWWMCSAACLSFTLRSPLDTSSDTYRRTLAFVSFIAVFKKPFFAAPDPATGVRETRRAPHTTRKSSRSCKGRISLHKSVVPIDVCNDAGLFHGQSVIAFKRRKYRPAELNYTVGEQELLAVIRALQVWRCYLEGAPKFKVITDHNPLVYMNTQNTLSRRQSQWVEFLQQFDFEWVYRPGRFNPADPLSRAGSLAEQPLALLHDGLALVHLTCKSFSPAFLATSYWPQHDSLR